MKCRAAKRALVSLLLALLLLCACLPAHAAQTASARTVVKVAFYQLDGFFEYDKNGKECGYGVDYLNELAKYSNIVWQYVPVDSWESISGLLASGQADVWMPISERNTPSAKYDYTVEPMLISYHAIMTRRDRADLYYQDYDAIAQMKLAITDNLLDKTGVDSYLRSIGAWDNLVYYSDYNACRAALDAGKVDGLISNVMDLTDEMKILDKFSVVNNYIITLKGNPCYTAVNNAMTRLKLENPSFQADLYEKYYPDRATEPFTRAESEYIADGRTLTVATYPDRQPVSYQDEDGVFRGIAIDLADLLAQKTGLRFTYVPVTTDSQAEMLQTADLVMPVPETIKDPDCFVTASILDPEILLVVCAGEDVPPSGAKVGVLRTTPGIRTMIEELDYFDVVPYADSRAALAALQNGQIAAFANSSYVIDWLLESPRYSNLSALRYQSLPLGYNLCGRATDTVLQSILNKGLHAITEDERAKIIQTNSRFSMSDLTLPDQLYIYRQQLALVALAAVLLGLAALRYVKSRNRYVREVEQSNCKQREASQAKSEFLARMSHDMRTPLNVIMGMSHLALGNDNPPDTNECLEKINISSEFLLGLINDVLDVEHIESGKLVLHPVAYSSKEFQQYIDAVITPLCEQKNIRFTYTYDGIGDFVVLQDKMRINQVYFNLLSNAVKFTPEGGRIHFHTHTEETGDGRLRIRATIADSGIGMSQSFLQHMFEPFVQESRDLRPISEGAGLGLAIVKRICDLMGVEISAESCPGSGTTFTLCGTYELIPQSPCPAPQSAPPVIAPETVLKDKAFLVCEDHPLNQEIIRRMLEKKGAIVVVADNGKRGVEAFEQSAPGGFAAILMDIRMPVMDGLQATCAIRALARPDAKTVPILALTANAYEEDVKKCRDAGMSAHLAKPVSPEQLYLTLAGFVDSPGVIAGQDKEPSP